MDFIQLARLSRTLVIRSQAARLPLFLQAAMSAPFESRRPLFVYVIVSHDKPIAQSPASLRLRSPLSMARPTHLLRCSNQSTYKVTAREISHRHINGKDLNTRQRCGSEQREQSRREHNRSFRQPVRNLNEVRDVCDDVRIIY